MLNNFILWYNIVAKGSGFEYREVLSTREPLASTRTGRHLSVFGDSVDVERVCEYCGVTFVARRDARFCSRGCGNRFRYPANREKVAARNRAWKQANHEKVIEYGRAYYEINRERVAEYYEANRNKVATCRREYRKANLDKLLVRERIYRETNPEKLAERQRAWALANPEKVRERNARRRARKLAAYVAPVDNKSIYKRDKYKCQLCGENVNMEKSYPDPMSPSIDHILPLSKGGTHEPDNVQLAHLRCNLKKHNTILPKTP